MLFLFFFFFFQAEDGIRDSSVTGVQTCALPISRHLPRGKCLAKGRLFGRKAIGGNSRQKIRGRREIGRAAGRGRGEDSVGAVSLKKKKKADPSERTTTALSDSPSYAGDALVTQY